MEKKLSHLCIIDYNEAHPSERASVTGALKAGRYVSSTSNVDMSKYVLPRPFSTLYLHVDVRRVVIEGKTCVSAEMNVHAYITSKPNAIHP